MAPGYTGHELDTSWKVALNIYFSTLGGIIQNNKPRNNPINNAKKRYWVVFGVILKVIWGNYFE